MFGKMKRGGGEWKRKEFKSLEKKKKEINRERHS